MAAFFILGRFSDSLPKEVGYDYYCILWGSWPAHCRTTSLGDPPNRRTPILLELQQTDLGPPHKEVPVLELAICIGVPDEGTPYIFRAG